MDPSIVVTYMKGIRAWIVRCLSPEGLVWMERAVKSRMEIGKEARSQLRMWDKCGGQSKYASRARHRQTEKGKQEKDQ